MTIENIVWVLPRPKRNKYRGGFPLWFEEKILKLYGFDYKNEDLKDRVLHMFAGMTKFGYRVDMEIGTLFCSWIDDNKMKKECLSIDDDLDMKGKSRLIFNKILRECRRYS